MFVYLFAAVAVLQQLKAKLMQIVVVEHDCLHLSSLPADTQCDDCPLLPALEHLLPRLLGQLIGQWPADLPASHCLPCTSLVFSLSLFLILKSDPS